MMDLSNFPVPAFADSPFGGSPAQHDQVSGLGVINLSLVPAYTGPKSNIFPAGTYDAVVKKLSYGLSKKGSPMLTWTFKAFDARNQETTVWYYSVLTDPDPEKQNENLGRLVKAIQALAPDFDLETFNPSTCGTELIDRTCRLKLKVGEPFNGRQKNEIDFDGILPAGPSNRF